MKKLVFLCVLLAAVGILSAELAWPEPVTVVNYENVRYSGHSLQTSDGCHLLVWWQNDNAVPGFNFCFCSFIFLSLIASLSGQRFFPFDSDIYIVLPTILYRLYP